MTTSSLPGAPFLARRGDDLFLDGVRLAELAAEFGTPLYVYSRGAMRTAATAYQGALAGRPHLLCYAMKANSTLAVLKTLADLGLGFDIVSAGELARVLAVRGRSGQGGVLGRGQDPRRDAHGPAGRREVLQRRERQRAGNPVAGGG